MKPPAYTQESVERLIAAIMEKLGVEQISLNERDLLDMRPKELEIYRTQDPPVVILTLRKK